MDEGTQEMRYVGSGLHVSQPEQAQSPEPGIDLENSSADTSRPEQAQSPESITTNEMGPAETLLEEARSNPDYYVQMGD